MNEIDYEKRSSLSLMTAKSLRMILGEWLYEFLKHVRHRGLGVLVREVRLVLAKRRCSQDAVTLAVCAIMKNEATYLREWIEFHRLMGVEKFYLYDNDSTDNPLSVLKPFIEQGIVEYIPIHGECQQLPAYEDCIARYGCAAKWIAFIDLDEFMVPQTQGGILPILQSLPANCGQVLMEWRIFGSNGEEKRRAGLVIERFTRRAAKSWLTKAIVNPRRVYMANIHWHYATGKTVKMASEELHINHYHCKSWEEYSLKAARGEACSSIATGKLKYQRECFALHDLNDIEDLCAAKFAPLLSSSKDR